MDLKFLIKKIRLERAAKKAGCCRDYRGRILRAVTDQELIDIYMKGIRFCMRTDYPSTDFIARNFMQQMLEDRGIYLSQNIELYIGQHREVIALGCCNGSLRYGEFAASRLVAKNNSKFDIEVVGQGFLMLDILDEATVDITARDNARVIAYRYGHRATLRTTQRDNAAIKVVERDPREPKHK